MTPIQRLQLIANGLVDGTATAQQMTAAADAYVAITPDDEIRSAFGVDRSQLTSTQKAQVFIEWMLRDVRKTMRYAAEQQAMTDAASGIKAAGDAAAGAL